MSYWYQKAKEEGCVGAFYRGIPALLTPATEGIWELISDLKRIAVDALARG